MSSEYKSKDPPNIHPLKKIDELAEEYKNEFYKLSCQELKN